MYVCTAGRTVEVGWKQWERKELFNGCLFPEEEAKASSQAYGGAAGTEKGILNQDSLDV